MPCFLRNNCPILIGSPANNRKISMLCHFVLTRRLLQNIAKPAILDVADNPWRVEPVEAVYAANCVHIMSWGHVVKMFQGLDKALKPGGHLVLYGPFKYKGDFTSDSNARFEQWLKGNDPQSGIRDFEKVDALAKEIGLSLLADHNMPANNQCLIWQRTV